MYSKGEYIKIYHHFGQDKQNKKITEETDELVVAIESGNRALIVEEVADVCVLMQQLIDVYSITTEELQTMMKHKHDRTLDRIKSGYYDPKPPNICDECRHQPLCTWDASCSGRCFECTAYNAMCNPRITPCAKRKALQKIVDDYRQEGGNLDE